MISNTKGTILNYFGLSNTYNPFKDENALQIAEDLYFEIPSLEPFEASNYVAVSTGLLTNSLSFLNDCIFEIYDNNVKVSDLQNVIGEIGNDKYMPKEGQIFWFNKDGLRGTYFLHHSYAGKKLKIVSGRYITTSITSGVLNDMFERTVGVPSYIEEINNMIDDIKNNSSFIIKEVVTKSGTGTQQWELDWRDDLEYLQVAGYVSGNSDALLSLSSYGLYQSINDSAPFIGWFGSSSSHYYYGGEFQKSFNNYQAGLPNLKWFPIFESKPVLGLKNNSENTVTAYLYFLVRYKQ
ncbi:phage tail protein [Brachyspira hampsonii]|uniref:phage tail protein n=1 Tax=Brachyspira hampsonii TaxID=1287055 RepID=UPI000D3A0CC4|nr:phage tail protein [Brachyspira hampsonii]PTY39244.1 Hvp 32 VSH-1 tail protein [Brachyspira hampsonii bv. II]